MIDERTTQTITSFVDRHRFDIENERDIELYLDADIAQGIIDVTDRDELFESLVRYYDFGY